MLNSPTTQKLKDIKLKVMASMLADPDPTLQELTFEERLGLMVDKEWLARNNLKDQEAAKAGSSWHRRLR